MFKAEEQAKQEVRVKQAAASRANIGPGKGLFCDLQTLLPA
jgi:hypothetical protein